MAAKDPQPRRQPAETKAPGGLRSVTKVVKAFDTIEGDGMEIRRALPFKGRDAVGPFIFLDHFGPVTYGPGEAKGAPEHPHRGFETLSYLLEGRGEHRDSIGSVSLMTAGEAQWMRAGRGILHDEGADEALRRDGGTVHGLQFWINLPPEHKMDPPAYKLLGKADIPVITEDKGRVTIKLLSGELGGKTGPLDTYTRPWLAHVAVKSGVASVTVPAGFEAAAYIAAGTGRFGVEGHVAGEGELVQFGEGDDVLMTANTPLDVMVFGGPKMNAPIRRYGPFVMNTEEELEQAVIDFQAGKFGSIPR